MAPEPHSDVYCADCGLQILDSEDVTFTLDSAGSVTTALHTEAFHRELVGDDDAGLSPFAYYDMQQEQRRLEAESAVCAMHLEAPCDLPARYAFDESDRTTYACSIHRDAIARDMFLYASSFTYRVLDTGAVS